MIYLSILLVWRGMLNNYARCEALICRFYFFSFHQSQAAVIPDSAGCMGAASSWLVLWLRSGSLGHEMTHSRMRQATFTGKKSGLYTGTTPERSSLEKKF